jgi:hypothetical protein
MAHSPDTAAGAGKQHWCTTTQYGFGWGPMYVTRIAEYRGYVVLDITTITGKDITIYVSPKGHSIRVFGDGGEWKKP